MSIHTILPPLVTIIVLAETLVNSLLWSEVEKAVVATQTTGNVKDILARTEKCDRMRHGLSESIQKHAFLSHKRNRVLPLIAYAQPGKGPCIVSYRVIYLSCER